MKKNRALLVIVAMVMVLSLSGCGIFDSKVNSLKGSLLGVSYTAEFYDNYGAQYMSLSGENIDIDGNIVEGLSIDSSGNTSTNYTLSSVITITIDGKQAENCGNTVIFAESGLHKDVDFELSDIESQASGFSSLTSISKVVNKYKNYFGKSQVVVIQSQLGIPICAYSGDKVYWEIPNDLPTMTKVMIDGKALYIHRANFDIIDKDLLE